MTQRAQALAFVAWNGASSASRVAGVVLVLLVGVAMLAPVLPLRSPVVQDLAQFLVVPNSTFPFGTDDLGRDILSRTVWGARLSLVAGTVPVLLALMGGLVLGVLSAYHGGLFGQIVVRFTDFLLSIPYFLIALIIVSVLGPGLWNAMLAIAISVLPSFIRLARASTLAVKGLPYALAAHAVGMNTARIMLVHIVPNVIAPLLVFATVKVGESILAVAALSFLGLGAQPPTPEWGLMLSNARELVLSAPHAVLFPSAALSVTVLAVNVLADGLRDTLDPRYRY